MFIAELFSTGLNQDSYKISINSYIESVKQFIDNLINPWNTPLGYISFEDIVVCFLWIFILFICAAVSVRTLLNNSIGWRIFGCILAIIGIAVLVNLWIYGDLLEIIRYCAIASMFFGIFFGMFKTKLPGSNTNIQH